MNATDVRVPARRRAWWDLLRVALAIGLLAGFAATPTLASWTDDERASTTFEAAVLPSPTLTRNCTYYGGVLGIGAAVRIYWALPEGYDLGDVEIQASTSGLGSVLAPLTGFSVSGNTQRLADGTYRTDVPTNLLGGLLGLGSELEIAIVLAPEAAGGWTSAPASVASNAGLLVGIGGNCRNLA